VLPVLEPVTAPLQPVLPTIPTLPELPTQSETPTISVNPITPTSPVPGGPIAPPLPAGPVSPTTPLNPVSPMTPVIAPVAPGESPSMPSPETLLPALNEVPVTVQPSTLPAPIVDALPTGEVTTQETPGGNPFVFPIVPGVERQAGPVLQASAMALPPDLRPNLAVTAIIWDRLHDITQAAQAVTLEAAPANFTKVDPRSAEWSMFATVLAFGDTPVNSGGTSSFDAPDHSTGRFGAAEIALSSLVDEAPERDRLLLLDPDSLAQDVPVSPA
jgi:hypothetical protein